MSINKLDRNGRVRSVRICCFVLISVAQCALDRNICWYRCLAIPTAFTLRTLRFWFRGRNSLRVYLKKKWDKYLCRCFVKLLSDKWYIPIPKSEYRPRWPFSTTKEPGAEDVLWCTSVHVSTGALSIPSHNDSKAVIIVI